MRYKNVRKFNNQIQPSTLHEHYLVNKYNQGVNTNIKFLIFYILTTLKMDEYHHNLKTMPCLWPLNVNRL